MLKVSLTSGSGQGHAKVNGFAKILDVEKLIAVAAVAKHGKTAAVLRPIIKEREYTKALGSHKGLGANYRYDHAFVSIGKTDVFSFHLGFAIRADTDSFIVFIQGMMIRNTVYGS